MKNKIEDLRNHLFEQLERLNDDDLKGPDLDQEIKRASAISEVSAQIIESAKVQVMFIKVTESTDKSTFFLGEGAK